MGPAEIPIKASDSPGVLHIDRRIFRDWYAIFVSSRLKGVQRKKQKSLPNMPLEGTMVLKKRRHDGDLIEHDCIAETMNILRSGNTILMPVFLSSKSW